MTEHPYTNRLISEKSPYLLQHAHNPVDWYPWGEDAFHAARALDKPIFLSIGYATCHWCHVMEEESFSDPELAQALNETFICVKVDREELPEIDALYMEFAQAMMAGAAGWPLNLVLTTDLKPFFATTYLPPEGRHGLSGLKDLIGRMAEAWKSPERGRLLVQAEKVYDAFAEQTHTTGDKLPQEDYLDDAADLIFQMADPVYGGMRGNPKFPVGYQMNFMLRHSRISQDSRTLFLVEKTLDWMARGGIHDHLAGGFARYSVDERWSIPHFEKMLYDNAFLMEAYLEAWQVSKRVFYRQVAEETADYLLRDMQREGGGFFSAEDADTEGKEGFFYTWTLEEIHNILGPQDAPLFSEVFNVSAEGNFEGRNVLYMTEAMEDLAEKHDLDVPGLVNKLKGNCETLRLARARRPHPFKDDKVLSGWNGLVIHALCRLGCATGNQEYLDTAEKAARFIRESMVENRHVLRRWRDGEARFYAGLDEYASLIRGLLSLYEADRGTQWLGWATELAALLERDYKAENGAFYQTNGEDPHVILRRCQYADGAEPSGNGVHCENLIRLARLTQNDHYLAQAMDILKACQPFLEHYPPGYLFNLLSFQFFSRKESPVFVVSLNEKELHKEEIHQLLFHCFVPHRSVIWNRVSDQDLQIIAPFLSAFPPHNGDTTLYILGAKDDLPVPITNLTDMIEAVHSLR